MNTNSAVSPDEKHRAQMRQYYWNNRETLLEKQKNYYRIRYALLTEEEYAQRMKQIKESYNKNREKRLERMREYSKERYYAQKALKNNQNRVLVN